MVPVTAPGLYRVPSVASARRARDAYVEVMEADGSLHATVLGVDEDGAARDRAHALDGKSATART
ncbi:hypothetical protein QEG98_34275 [Myxococcus sp. MxC21-1]|uniref:hypothetical protein n=1 Tax=Myxococcus sp. MxC21-1 TaxID=3041439 RepID=UPI00292ED3DF|nr:hypothetical protein [Myxococcus sp. MxC21-1]WNZ60941.1 hypothetical protein QEG98_34275 [Myxococcus sp. MxC21-1]